MSNESRKKHYVSLGFHELDLLQKLGWGERAMYLELKRMANFKTGQVGVFHSQKLSWEELGRLVSVPSAQGRAAKPVDGKEAALIAHFAERDRWFRGIVTDAVMLHGYGLMLP